MDHIKAAKCDNVQLIRRGTAAKGTLHLTTHHLIFSAPAQKLEVWVCYPMIQQVEKRNPRIGGSTTLRVRCRDFSFFALDIPSESDATNAFETMQKLTCVESIEYLYAFSYEPGKAERAQNGWAQYPLRKEFERMGVGTTNQDWRFTDINSNFAFGPTYPSLLVVPADVSDNVIAYAGKYRSKARIPALTYIHPLNQCTITRSSQPMVGLKQNRSPQDERLVESIFRTRHPPAAPSGETVYGSCMDGNLIVDARPTTNAMANVAIGAGSENMDHYRRAKKAYLGIDNIHVMRESLTKVVEALKDTDISPLPPNRESLTRSGWLKHIANLIDGAVIIAQTIHVEHAHVLVHCSDGWDRTSQLSSLAQICLDPFYRTLDGFMTLIEKDWLAFGHRFAERAGYLSSERSFVSPPPTELRKGSNAFAQNAFNGMQRSLMQMNRRNDLKYTSPVFHQFLDCTYQILSQYPNRFEFNERFLRRLLYHSYSCQYGTFLYNSERERVQARAAERTRSVWDYFLARRHEWVSGEYEGQVQDDVLFPKIELVHWWSSAFGRESADMNAVPSEDTRNNTTSQESGVNKVRVEMEMGSIDK